MKSTQVYTILSFSKLEALQTTDIEEGMSVQRNYIRIVIINATLFSLTIQLLKINKRDFVIYFFFSKYIFFEFVTVKPTYCLTSNVCADSTKKQ